MGYEILRCPYCGNEGKLERRDDAWFCAHCGNISTEDNAEKLAERIQSNIGAAMAGAIDSALLKQREEQYYNLRSLLWEKVYAKYTDSSAILSICRDIKKLDPHDFLASFYEIANSGSADDISSFIHNISIGENGVFADMVIDFMLKSLTSEYIMPVSYLIERAYKGSNLVKFEEYVTKLENEAAKVDSGIYSTLNPRDVFIAYSSKDMDKVIELMNLLESNGLSCFVALRNLQHGRGAVANYRTALREAINNSKIVVFVSSKNSRNFSCDALKEELGYIRESELKSAPPEYKNDYANLPSKYKKMRIEYRLDDTPSPVDRFVREFFANLDYCESPEKVLARIADYTFYGMNSEEEEEAPEVSESIIPAPAPVQESKTQTASSNSEDTSCTYCTKCGAKNKIGAKFCASCGNNKLVEKSEKFCLSCGTKNELNAKFCDSCGESDFAFSRSECAIILNERKEAEIKAREEAERKAKEEAERKVREEKMRKEREEAERLRKEEEEKRALAAADERAIQESNDLVEKHCVVKNGTIEKCNYTGPALKKFIIPSHIHSIGERAFENCKIADHIVFHGGIKSMGQFAFAKTPVSKVTLLEGIKTIDSFAFYSCERLSQVELPNSLTKIDGYAFQYCKFNEIKLPENLFEIGCNAFQYTGLVRLHIPKKVKNIAPGFCTAYGLKEITVEQGNAYYTSIDGNLYDRLATTFHTLGRCAEPYSLTIPSSVQTIASHACSCSKKLTSVFIPQSVKRIDSMAFYRCESLTEVFIPKSVEFIGYSTFGVTRAKLKCEVKKPFLSLPQGWNKNWRDNASSVSWSCTR